LSTRGLVRVDPDFAEEFPDGDAASTEGYASICRTGEALLAEIERHADFTFGITQAMTTTLAVIDGAGEPLTPTEISSRLLVPSATMTATLDTLEDRGWIQRLVNPADRRSVLVEITKPGRATADQLLAGIRNLERTAMAALTDKERTQLLKLLGKVLDGAAQIAAEPPEKLAGRRVRPDRIG
jgi:DNA-binding MarR family transcriptional regulator